MIYDLIIIMFYDLLIFMFESSRFSEESTYVDQLLMPLIPIFPYKITLIQQNICYFWYFAHVYEVDCVGHVKKNAQLNFFRKISLE